MLKNIRPGNYILPIAYACQKNGYLDTLAYESKGLVEKENVVIFSIDISGFTDFANALKGHSDRDKRIAKLLSAFYKSVFTKLMNPVALQHFSGTWWGGGAAQDHETSHCPLYIYKMVGDEILGICESFDAFTSEGTYNDIIFALYLINEEMKYEGCAGVTAIFQHVKAGLYSGLIESGNYFDASVWGAPLNNMLKQSKGLVSKRKVNLCESLYKICPSYIRKSANAKEYPIADSQFYALELNEGVRKAIMTSKVI
jgi:hypothetical protein